MIHSFRIYGFHVNQFCFHSLLRVSKFDQNSLLSPLSLQNSKRLWISLWQIPPNIIWILKLPSNIWMIIALYPPIVQVVRLFTRNMTRVESNSWEKWKIFKPSEANGSKTDWHENHIFWTSESWFISTNLFETIQAKCVNARHYVQATPFFNNFNRFTFNTS